MIVKLQQGGGIGSLPTYTITNPISVDPFSSTESSTTKSGKKSKDSEEPDLQKILMDADLLPNDTAYLAQQINRIERLSSVPGFTGVGAFMSKFQHDLSKAKYHKEAHTKAVAQAEKVNALPEVAITKDNKLVGINTETGKIQYLTVEQARSGNYRILSNNEIKDLNSQELGYTFDTTLLEALQNGTSMSQVNKEIKDASMNIGTTAVEKGGYTLQMAQDIQAGLQVAKQNQEGMPLAGLYKSKQITKEQANQALLALDYIYTMIQDNARTLLIYKTGSEQAAKELIFKRLGAQANPYSSFETSLELDASGKKPGTQSSTKDTLPDLTEVEKWLYGYGYKEQFNLVGGTSDAITFTSTVLSMTDKGNPVGQTTLQKAIGGDFNGVLDMRSVTMGNQVIDTNALDKVILKDGRIYKVELPINQELYTQGIIAPDYNYSKNKEKADALIKERNITDKQQINAIYEDNNLPIKYDENGNLITTHYATFGALHAIALDQAFVDEDSLAMTSYLKEIAEEREAKNALQIYKQLNGLSKDDETLKDWDYQDKPWNERSHNALYEGILYIPVQANFANAKVGQGISPSEMDELHRMQVETDAAKQLKRTGWNDGK